MTNGLDMDYVRGVVKAALDEDGAFRDVTTLSLVPPEQLGRGVFLAKEPGVVCGVPVAQAAFAAIDPSVRMTALRQDGQFVEAGGVIAEVDGALASILSAERVALNFMQRLGGTATLTRALVDVVAGTNARVVDTRKTTPGLRALEKYAVRVGGGASHRSDLASGVLLKDNHIALVGSVREAVRRARANAPHVLRVVVEVDDLAQLDEALEAGAEGILLDNFQARDMTEAVKRVRERRPQVVIEASGGVTLDRIHEISKTGVDVVSIGSITHSARAVDFSCEIRPTDGARERDA